MAYTLVDSTSDEQRVQWLLNKNVPSYRQAYSDRTAWIMACLSELSYLRFNPLFSREEHKEYFLQTIEKLVDDNKKASLLKLIDIVAYDPAEEKRKLEFDLGLLKLELLETFDKDGTQAILVRGKSFLGLAFRGTEATSIKDIKADAKATPAEDKGGGRVHSGFKHAFEKVAYDVQKVLDQDEFKTLPLFIAGHSLGGAVATVAAKRLSHKGGIAACYTFGAPRVGDDEWIFRIKTPVYRLVNAADCVTMLPPGTEIITVAAWASQIIPRVGRSIRAWITKFGGYIHGGHMRYLTNCPEGEYDDVKILYSVSFFYRIKGLIIKKLPWKTFLSDHSIEVYRKKLLRVAESRNPDQAQ